MANTAKLHSTYAAATSLQTQELVQPALLKIEPFVPSLQARLRRPIGRSYSTLSSTSTATPTSLGQRTAVSKCEANAVVAVKAAAPKTTRPPAARHLRRHQMKWTVRQRSKSTSSSSASNRPTTIAVNGLLKERKDNAAVADATVHTSLASNVLHAAPSGATQSNAGTIATTQPNGICRITRVPHEQEKLPDRINYDRRGLTAIPYFENEPNLRLLSLQHNLINVFHIPSPVQSSPARADLMAGRAPKLARPQDTSTHHHQLKETAETTALQSIARPGEMCSPPPALNADSPLLTTLPLATGGLLNRNKKLQQKNLNFNPPAMPQLPCTNQQAQYRFALKKSKSFMINYTRQMGNIKRSIQKSYVTKNEVSGQASSVTGPPPPPMNTVNLKLGEAGANDWSADSPGVALRHSDMDEEHERGVQLEIKNNQLQPFYDTIFRNLVFLDLYDNQIERVANLDGLANLSVLLLGKNRIADIAGLASLSGTLRVLDLHGNKITSIANRINALHQLKSLNLAGNQIRQINQTDFNGLVNLKELNLKRNRIRRINGFQHLTALERLWLCHNELHKVEDMASIAKAPNLLEVTVENNPVSLAGDCVSFLVSYLPRLQSLSQMAITEQVRRAALAWRKNKELSEANNHSHLSADMRRDEVISNARTNWELLRSQQIVQSTLRCQRSPKRTSELTKINEEAVVSYDELQELIKLPPIEQRLLQATPQQAALQKSVLRLSSSSSGSSLGPNVDSCSSCYSSENEESILPESEEGRALKKCQPLSATAGPSVVPPAQPKATGPLNSDSASAPEIPAAKNTRSTEVGATNDCDSSPPLNALAVQTAMNSSTTSAQPGLTDATIKMLSSCNNCAATTTERPKSSHVRPTANAVRALAQSRSATPTAFIMANNSELSLSLQTASQAAMHCISDGLEAANHLAASPQPTAATASTVIGKRYMPGSLVRSQTVIGSDHMASTATRHCGHQANSNAGRMNGSLHQTATTSKNTNSTANAAGNSPVLTVATTQGIAAGAITTNGNKVISPMATSNANPLNHVSSSSTAGTQLKASLSEREREQGGDFLIEICGRYLNVYGQGALRFIDKQWNSTKANDVHTLNFSYINFINIATIMPRIKVRFPHAENFVFRETNISRLGELNALAELQGITALFIDPEGNTVTTKDLWRQYAIYRLSHWGLKTLNGHTVTDAETLQANAVYAGLSDLVLWSMPDVMLRPLLSRLRLEETCIASKMSSKEWLMKADNRALQLVVGKEALQWKKPHSTQHQQNQAPPYYADRNLATAASATGVDAPPVFLQGTHERGKMHFTIMLENTCNAVDKLHRLETLWPSLLLDIVRNTLLDYSQLDVYLRNLMAEIMK